MYVVFNTETGWSDESMRFSTEEGALGYIESQYNSWAFSYRIED